MPEGDTIWRTARTLEAALAGKTVTGFQSSLPAVAVAAERLGIVGRIVDSVQARGKHLLVRFAGGATLHTHQGMKGSWHIYRPGRSRPPQGHPRVAIQTADAVAVCRLAPVVEVLSSRQTAAHPALQRLGPDILAADFDPQLALARLRARGGMEIGVALLDQTALAGLGNVYKSELLFLAGVTPTTRVAELDDASLDRLVTLGRQLMLRNLGPGPRRTTSALAPTPVWVYRRAGRPCRRCGAAIRRVVQGEQVRSTYFCPGCQRPGSPSGDSIRDRR